MKEQTIKRHELEYYHIPKLKGNPLYLFVSIFFGYIAYLNLKLIDYDVIKFVFNCIGDECKVFNQRDLINLYPIIAEYILICFTIISFIKIFKKELKPYNEDGLIYGSIFGLTGGLIFGLTVGLTVGLIAGLIAGLIYGLIAGLMAGLIYGFIAGLIYGLIAGLMGEFE